MCLCTQELPYVAAPSRGVMSGCHIPTTAGGQLRGAHKGWVAAHHHTLRTARRNHFVVTQRGEPGRPLQSLLTTAILSEDTVCVLTVSESEVTPEKEKKPWKSSRITNQVPLSNFWAAVQVFVFLI